MPANNIQLGLRLTADGKGFVGQVRIAKQELDKLTGSTSSATTAGRRYNRITRETATVTRKAGDSFGEGQKRMLRYAGGFVTLTAAIRAFRSILQKTITQEQALAQVAARLKSTGGAAGHTTEQIARMAAELQQVTSFGDEAILSMQALLLSFDKIDGSQFERVIKAILDISGAQQLVLDELDKQYGKLVRAAIKAINDAFKKVNVKGFRQSLINISKPLPGLAGLITRIASGISLFAGKAAFAQVAALKLAVSNLTLAARTDLARFRLIAGATAARTFGVAITGASVAVRGFGAVLAFLTNPIVGLLALAGFAAYELATANNETEESFDGLTGSIEEYKKSLTGLEIAELKLAEFRKKEQIEQKKREIAEVNAEVAASSRQKRDVAEANAAIGLIDHLLLVMVITSTIDTQYPTHQPD